MSRGEVTEMCFPRTHIIVLFSLRAIEGLGVSSPTLNNHGLKSRQNS